MHTVSDTSQSEPETNAQEPRTALPATEPVSEHPPNSDLETKTKTVTDARKTSPKMGRQDVLTIDSVTDALSAAHGVKTLAARALGVSYPGFWKWMKKHMPDGKPPVEKGPTLQVIRADLHERNRVRIEMRDKHLTASAGAEPTGMENQNHPPGTTAPGDTTPPSPSPLITAEVVSGICRFMLENECGLIPACRSLGYKATAVHYFMSKKGNETIREEYLAIRFALVDMAVDQMDEVAEDCDPVNYNAQRVKLSAMQWKASALRPDLYGGVKKNDTFIAPGSEKKLTDEELDRRIRGTLAKLDALEGREPKPRETTATTEVPAVAVDSGLGLSNADVNPMLRRVGPAESLN